MALPFALALALVGGGSYFISSIYDNLPSLYLHYVQGEPTSTEVVSASTTPLDWCCRRLATMPLLLHSKHSSRRPFAARRLLWDPGICEASAEYEPAARSPHVALPRNQSITLVLPLGINSGSYSIQHPRCDASIDDRSVSSPVCVGFWLILLLPFTMRALLIPRCDASYEPAARSTESTSTSVASMATSSDAQSNLHSQANRALPIPSLFHHSHPILSRPTVPNIQ